MQYRSIARANIKVVGEEDEECMFGFAYCWRCCWRLLLAVLVLLAAVAVDILVRPPLTHHNVF
jgi:hypothetical protein